MSLLAIEQLSVEFTAGNQRRAAFSDLSFTLEQGEFLCVIGPSGCGKTTLLRSIAGFVAPTQGRVLLAGQPVGGPGSHCAMVFQTFDQLLPWRTVLGNVSYPLLVQKKAATAAEARDTARRYLHMVGMEKYAADYPHQLSGGMKQRVAIARALALRPSLILMDEPFASLDADSRTGLQRELKRLWAESGLTVVFVTHSIIEAIGLSTRVLAMGDGAPSLRLLEENPVSGPRDRVKTPASPGYSAYWDRLNCVIRGGR